ncbi:MAG: L-ascorbate metabolism protein UlaG (beta-lactamase superfamily) [Bradymonadia bacterium]|jgi:L-ascorbate metabolism protein UlaG (beta-lactamase superfamily)
MKRWRRRILLSFLVIFGLLVTAAGVLAAFAWTAAGTKPDGARLARVQQSPQYKDGNFFNALPEKMDAWAATKRMFQGGDHRTPEGAIPTASKTNLSTPPASGLRVTWLGHSSVLIEIDGARILTDPVWGERVFPISFLGPKRFYPVQRTLEELMPIDAVVLSHDHYDHLDEGSIRKLSALGVRFITPLGIGAHLEYWGVAADRITELDWWQTETIGDLTLACTPSRHFSGRFLTDRNATLWASWSLIGPTHRVFFSGDTAMFPGFKEIGAKYGPFDVVLMESGAYDKAWMDVHIGPEQGVEAFADLKGKLLIPVHWGTFNLAIHNWTEPVERLLVAAKKVGAEVYVPKPGESIEPASMPASQKWWPDVPWQTATENPIVSSGL